MLSTNALVTQLSTFGRVFGKHMDKTELLLLAGVWRDALSGINDSEFVESCKLLIKRCQFFPKPAEVIAAVSVVRQRPRESYVAIPQSGLNDPVKKHRHLAFARVLQLCCAEGVFGGGVLGEFNVEDVRSKRKLELARQILGPDYPEFENLAEEIKRGSSWLKDRQRRNQAERG